MNRIVIFDFNRTIYDPEIKKLARDTTDVLCALKGRGFELCLISRGNSLRMDLIKELGVVKYFKEIVVTKEKSMEDFKKMAMRRDVDVGRSFIIGDRVREEIFFGNSLGFQTIWLREGKCTDEFPRSLDERPTFVVNEMLDILGIVDR